MDALGGLLLSFVVIANWTKTSMHHVRNLTGCAASPDERNLRKFKTHVLQRNITATMEPVLGQ